MKYDECETMRYNEEVDESTKKGKNDGSVERNKQTTTDNELDNHEVQV